MPALKAAEVDNCEHLHDMEERVCSLPHLVKREGVFSGREANVDGSCILPAGNLDQSANLDQQFRGFLARPIQILLSHPTLLLCLPMRLA